MACSTWCRATRWRWTRLLAHPDVKARQLRRLHARLPATSTRPAPSHGKRVQALGGAKNHMVVMPDAGLDQAVDALIGAAYGSAGERCMAISAWRCWWAMWPTSIVPKLLERTEDAQVIRNGMEPRRRNGPHRHRSAHKRASRGYIDARRCRKAPSCWPMAAASTASSRRRLRQGLLAGRHAV